MKRMKYRISERIMSIALCVCMVLSLMPSYALTAHAAEIVSGTACEHHTEHTAECGYVEAVEGSPCTHTHDEACGYDTVSGNEVCSHVHDEICGYVEAVEGVPCNYVCESCVEENNEEQPENETAECTCGTDDDSIHATNCAVYVAPENPVCTCVEKCTEANVWCDVCGLDYNACIGTDEAIVYENTTSCTTHTFTDGVCTVCGIIGGYCGASTNEGGESSVTWTLKDGTLTISGSGAMADYETNDDDSINTPWFIFKDSIKTVIIDNGVTSIGDRAFFEHCNLSSVEIPGSMTSIGYGAFYQCSSLTSIEIPGSLISIDKYAFNACGLTKINIPNCVTSIGQYTFAECYSLTTIEISDNLASIGQGAFYCCTGLESITLPDKLKIIGDRAFSQCYSLTSIKMPKDLERIGSYAFKDCRKLKSIEIPNSVDSIGDSAFSGCDNLTTVIASCKWRDSFSKDIDTFTHTRVDGYFANGNKIYYNCENWCIADDLEAARLELVSDDAIYYTGSEITPEVRVVYADDWTTQTQPDINNCTYSNNTNPGTATCTFTYEARCVLTLKFTINKALLDVKELPTVEGRIYNPSVALQDDDLKDGTVLDVNGNTLTGTWSWQKAGIIPTVGNSGYVAVFKPDNTNYGTVTATIKVNVEKATPDIGTVSANPSVLQDTLEVDDVVLSRTDETIDGTLFITDDTLQYGTHEYNWKFTPTGDYAANYKEITGIVEITVEDTIAPTASYQIETDGWKQFVNTISFGLFCKDYKTVEISYNDEGSGIATKQYYISNEEIADTSSIEWKVYTGKISLNATGTYFIYVRVVDNGGNEVILNSEGIVIYAESTISPTNIDYTYKSNADVSVQIALNGNTFAKLTDGAGNEIATGNYTIDTTTGELTLNAAYLDTLKVGTYTYKVYMNPQGVETTEVTLAYEFTVNVTAKELTVTGATATSRDYNETNTVEIIRVTLSGVEYSDAVAVDLTGLQGILSSANAGTYTSVTLPTLTLTGADAGNYTLVQPTEAVATSVTINKLNPTITCTTEYNKTFGDADFTLDVTDDNPEADVTYALSNEGVITISNGTATIKNRGNATVTVSLAESTNYNAAESKTITVTVAPATYTVEEINKSYLYSRENADSINLMELIPSDYDVIRKVYCSTSTAGTVTYSAGPSVTDDYILNYTVASGNIGASDTITVVLTTWNYGEITITVNVELIDQIPVSPKEGTEVTLQNNTLTYGEALSNLEFNSVVFVDSDGNEVAGTLAWKEPSATPNAGTTTATWVFTPSNEEYASLEGTVAITVNKATPIVSAVPTVRDRVYNPSVVLQDSDLKNGAVNVPGTWSWQTANIIPVVNNSGYVAVFKPSDSTNYETVTRTITVTVTEATPHIATAPSAADITYGDTLGSSVLSNGVVQYSDTDNTVVAGSFAWKDGNTKPAVSDSNTTTYTVVFTPADTTNYNTVETTITLTVNKAENAPNMPGNTMSAPYSNKTVGAVTLPEGWAWQDADKNTALEVGVSVEATAVYTGTDKGNYENESVVITITRSACEHTNTEVRNAKTATCEETGYTGDTYCTDCEECIKTGTEIPLADHKGGTATCTKKAVCSVCGKEYGSVDSSKHGETEIKGYVAATCTAGGYTGDTYCKDCSVKISSGTATAALGHNYTSEVTKEPTTTEEGVRTYTCAKCNDTYTESIPKLPEDHKHNYTSFVTKKPTCTENGVRTYTCSCGDSYTETIAKTDHDYKSEETKKPTTTEEGEMTYTCLVCGHTYTQPIEKIADDGSDNNEDSKPDTGKPFIIDDKGKEGWDVIRDEVEVAKDGDTVTVDMNGATVVPGDVFNDIKGRDVTIVFDMGNGITWSVNGKDITSDNVGDIDFGVKVGADANNTIPVDVINKVTGERYSMNVSLAYDGEFGFKAVLSLNMDAKNAGLYANLFYFNEQTGELEFICADEIAADGTAELTFTHASEYTILIDENSMAISPETGDTTEDAWRNWWIVLLGAVIMIIGLGVFFVVKKKKEDEAKA